MNSRKASQSYLPHVPVRARPNTDDFWTNQGSSGAVNAFRQLTSTVRKGGRRKAALPGGKLQPLFKNHSSPSNFNGGRKSSKSVLLHIPNPSPGTGKQLNHVWCGGSDGIPGPSPKIVKIYLCSNYEDMQPERAALFQKALPPLQEYCADRGLQLQLVDLHFGLGQKDVLSTYNSRELASAEIQSCQRLSLGPNFVLLLGEKVGRNNPINRMSRDDFEKLKEASEVAEVPHGELWGQCYEVDENARPPDVRIQRDIEREDLARLQSLFNRSVELLTESGELETGALKRHSETGLESEVGEGILSAAFPRSHCLCYHREFRDVDVSSPSAGTFLDLTAAGDGTAQRVDDKARGRAGDLYGKVLQHLGVGNCKSYYVKWGDQDPQAPNHDLDQYLDKLCEDFITDVKDLVDRAFHEELKLSPSRKPEVRELYEEVLYHANYGHQRLQNFIGREESLTRIERFLRDPRQNFRPFVIHGAPGSGKTTLMACAARTLKAWFTDDCVVVQRYLSTTSESDNIRHLVVSITRQICLAYGLRTPPRTDPEFDTLFQSLTFFRSTLDIVSGKFAASRPLFIVLDGLDRLHPQSESLRALWAFKDFPHNVHGIVSTVTQVGKTNFFASLASLVTTESATMEVCDLNEGDIRKYCESVLRVSDRSLTSEQESVLVETFNQRSQALYVEHVLHCVKRWPSHQGEAPSVPGDVGAIFDQKVSGLEKTFGGKIVKYFCTFLTVTPLGVSERDLIELLSNNAEVMKAKSVGGSAVFPPGLLALLKHELDDFLADHVVLGRVVLAWNHWEIYLAAGRKYHVVFPGIPVEEITEESTNNSLALHEQLTNLFLPERPSSVLGQRYTPTRTKGAWRLPQPVSVENPGKLSQLPLHMKVLVPVEGLQRVKDQLFFNLDWMLAKIQKGGVAALRRDLVAFLQLAKHLYEQGVLEDEDDDDFDRAPWGDMALLVEFLDLAEPACTHNPESLIVELLGRLVRPEIAQQYPSIQRLVEGAERYVAESSGPWFFPLYACFPGPGGPLRYTIQGPSHILGLSPAGSVVLFCPQTAVDSYRLDTGELEQRFAINKEQKLEGISVGHSSEFAIISHYSHLKHVMDIGVWSLETGVRLVHSSNPHRLEGVTVTRDDGLLLAAMAVDAGTRPGAPEAAAHRCIVAIDSRTKNVSKTLLCGTLHQDGVSRIIAVTGTRLAQAGVVVTVGSKRSRDFACWDLNSEELIFSVDLECCPDLVDVRGDLDAHVDYPSGNSKKLTYVAVVGSREEGRLVFVDLLKKSVDHSFTDKMLLDMHDIYVNLSRKYVLIATKQDGILVYSIEKRSLTKQLMPSCYSEAGDPREVPVKLAMDADDLFLFVGHCSGAIHVYNVALDERILVLKGHTRSITSLLFLGENQGPRGRGLLSAGEDHTARLWDVEPCLMAAEDRMAEAAILEVDDPFIATQGAASVLQKSEESSGDQGDVTLSDTKNVSCILLANEGQLLLTGSYTGPAKIWDVQTGKLIRVLSDQCPDGVSHLYTAYKGRLLIGHVIGSARRTVQQLKCWNLETLVPVKFDAEDVLVYTSCVCPSGDKLLVISPCSDNRQSGILLSIFDLFEMKCVSRLHCNIYGNMDATNLQLIGVSAEDKDTSGVSSGPGSKPGNPERPPGWLALLDYYPGDDTSYFFTFRIHDDGDVSGALDTRYRISMDRHDPIHLDTASPKCCMLLRNELCLTGSVTGAIVAWELANQRVAFSLHDNSLKAIGKVAKTASGLTGEVSGCPAHTGGVTCLALAGDAGLLASGGRDAAVRIWNLETKTLIRTFLGHSKQILDVSFAGKHHVLSGSEDKTVTLWTKDSASRVTSCYCHDNVVNVTMATSTKRLVVRTAAPDSTVTIFKSVNVPIF